MIPRRSDHLGSTAVSTNADGSWRGEIAYTPFGEMRESRGVTLTDYRYTGQRLAASVGLYYYGARWMDATLGRFTQADTLIPDPGNPLSLDRYAYAYSNPVKYIDPTGHVTQKPRDEGNTVCKSPLDCYYPEQWPDRSQRGRYILPSSFGREHSPSYGSKEQLEQQLWKTIPSAVGVNVGISGQAGFFQEAGITPIEFELVYNMYSGELDLFYSPSAYVYVGSPTGYSFNWHQGWSLYYGASNNDALAGWDVFVETGFGADEIGNLGGSISGSRSLKSNPGNGMWERNWFEDPISGIPVDKRQLNGVIGGNVVPNHLEIGVSYGYAYSVNMVSLFDIKLPWELNP